MKRAGKLQIHNDVYTIKPPFDRPTENIEIRESEENFISSVKILHFQMTYDLMKIVFSSLLLNFSIVIDLQ